MVTVDERKSQMEMKTKILPEDFMTKIYSRNSLTTQPGFNRVCELVTSDEDEVAWEVSETKLQLLNKKLPTFSEGTACMEGRPLGRWVSLVPVWRHLAVEQDNPARPEGWVQNIHALEIIQFLH